MNINASDRSALIRVASNLKVGSEERKTLLKVLKTSADPKPDREIVKGDRVQFTYRGESCTGIVKYVKGKGAKLTVDLTGQHSDEDVGYVDVAASLVTLQ